MSQGERQRLRPSLPTSLGWGSLETCVWTGPPGPSALKSQPEDTLALPSASPLHTSGPLWLRMEVGIHDAESSQ